MHHPFSFACQPNLPENELLALVCGITAMFLKPLISGNCKVLKICNYLLLLFLLMLIYSNETIACTCTYMYVCR